VVTPEEKMKTATFAEHGEALSSLYQSEELLSAIEKAVAAGEEFETRDALAARGPFPAKKRQLMKSYTIPYFDNVYPHIRFRPEMNVLFAAAGMGMDIKDLSKYSPPALNIYGIDICHSVLRLAVRNHVPARLSCGPAERLPFPDDFFDVIVSCETIEHLQHPERFVAEIVRVGKHGCQVFIGTPNGSSWAACHLEEKLYAFRTGRRFRPRRITDNHRTSREIRALADSADGNLKLDRMIFDMPFYFLCGLLPNCASGLIRIIKRLTAFVQDTSPFNRVFCDQAKYFFTVQKRCQARQSAVAASVFVCPECRNRLSANASEFSCDQCQVSYPVKDGIIVFLPDESPRTAAEKPHPGVRHKRWGAIKQLGLCFHGLALLTLWLVLLPMVLIFHLAWAGRRSLSKVE